MNFIALCPPSATGSNMSGQPPGMTRLQRRISGGRTASTDVSSHGPAEHDLSARDHRQVKRLRWDRTRSSTTISMSWPTPSRSRARSTATRGLRPLRPGSAEEAPCSATVQKVLAHVVTLTFVQRSGDWQRIRSKSACWRRPVPGSLSSYTQVRGSGRAVARRSWRS
jgi:hypothetical protein